MSVDMALAAIAFALAFLFGAWFGWGARGKQRAPIVAPVPVRAYIERRIAKLREEIIAGTGYIDQNRARLSELQSLKFELDRGD